MSDSPKPQSTSEDLSATEDRVEHLPQRAFADEPDAGGVAAFRTRVRRFALPGVLTLSVLAGLALAGATEPRPDTSIAAAPAAATAVTEEPRGSDQVSRDQERPAIDTPTAEPTPEPEPPAGQPGPPSQAPLMKMAEPAPTTSAPSAAGTRYATETVNVRAQASADSDKIGSVSQGDLVSITGKTTAGFSQILVDGKAGWVSSQYLSSSKPSTPAPSPTASKPAAAPRSASGSSSSGSAGSSDSSANVSSSGNCAPLSGLQGSTEKLHQVLCGNFPGVSSYGGVRSDGDYHHPSGLALDCMTSNSSLGWAIANFARANASSFGITQVIYQQKIWTTQRSSEGWRAMSDRGSATANHMDHVHIAIR
ncbi:SH3 domain-containing protein [Naumannella sp. ID2617S]|nr:SH3 domain-containing protein [Naumannella sp. ID2617S]